MSRIVLPEDIFMRRQQAAQKAVKPYHDAATKILATAIPSYILVNGQLKVKYPFKTLRILVVLRKQAREVIKSYESASDLEFLK